MPKKPSILYKWKKKYAVWMGFNPKLSQLELIKEREKMFSVLTWFCLKKNGE